MTAQVPDPHPHDPDPRDPHPREPHPRGPHPREPRAVPAMGLIVLRVDETIEHEFRSLIPAERARLYVTRVQSGDDLTPDSIAQMGSTLKQAASLLPRAADLDVVGYACTSGTALLGAATVARLVADGVPTRAVTNPLSAAAAQIRSLGLNRVGLVSPYMAPVADGLCAAFEALGVRITARWSLEESNEAAVARIDPEVTADAARRLVQRGAVDGVFLSCTNLNTLSILSPLADELGLPVLSSNAALAWHMQTLCAQR
ncbi:MAG: aspartate/glutamate racemase family protein [Pseudomonadota bacterium]